MERSTKETPALRIKESTLFKAALRRFKQNRLAVLGAGLIILIIFVAIFAHLIAPHHYDRQELRDRFSAPSIRYPLGTDALGRCLLSRIIYGARIALMIGVMIVGMQVTIGVTLGLVSGYYGGRIDSIIMRVVDTMLAFPVLVLALAIAATLGPGLFNVVIALGVIGWASYARMVRGQVLSVKENNYIEAIRAIGASNVRIMFRHILPNVIAPITVMATLGMAGALILAAAFSFLGIGAQPPMPCWGAILAAGRGFMRRAPWLATFPGLAIMVTVLGFNFLGDGLRDALDPRLKN
ncbi:ABC transporter permease [Candidatus Acetothermia bacterium]|jgi:peptide/nickel transport system permease protein|nr:ABC transporter permease [Candidatus Acetothermia bacterium]